MIQRSLGFVHNQFQNIFESIHLLPIIKFNVTIYISMHAAASFVQVDALFRQGIVIF